MFGRLLGFYTIYTFLGTLAPDGISPRAKFTLHPSLAFSPTLAALLHGTPAAGVIQTLRRGTRNGITELSQTAPPTFGWAAITLGIGPHSSFLSVARVNIQHVGDDVHCAHQSDEIRTLGAIMQVSKLSTRLI